MQEFYLYYLIIILGFVFGYYLNSRREKSSSLMENKVQSQLEGILQLDQEKIKELGFN